MVDPLDIKSVKAEVQAVKKKREAAQRRAQTAENARHKEAVVRLVDNYHQQAMKAIQDAAKAGQTEAHVYWKEDVYHPNAKRDAGDVASTFWEIAMKLRSYGYSTNVTSSSDSWNEEGMYNYYVMLKISWEK